MHSAPPWDRLAAILEHPPELLAYQRWLSEQESKSGDYLFADERVRFEPRKDDRVVARPGLSVAKKKGKALLRDAAAGIELPVPGVSAPQLEGLLAACDGSRCLIEVGWQAGVERAVLSRFLRATFGLVVFAPDAVAGLEERLPGIAIVRFPVAPYGIERPYWSNMADLRERAATDPPVEDFLRWLRELHVIALMGASLDSFYKPASPVADRQVAPGALFRTTARWMEGQTGPIYLDGPRVHVPPLGGEGYQRALVESLDDPAALDDERIFSRDGLDWGRSMAARSELERDPKPMFLPPRPMQPGHFEALHQAWQDAQGDEDPVAGCARFHQRWVRLHPFLCANQSLAMNLVNLALERAAGASIPHLMLDHLALRLSEEAYVTLFRRAVAAYALPEATPAERLAALIGRSRQGFAAIRAVDGGESPSGLERAGAAAALLV